MKCPICNAWAEVKETRKRDDNSKRRRYECGNEHRFTTVERVEEVKPGGARAKRKAPDGNNR